MRGKKEKGEKRREKGKKRRMRRETETEEVDDEG